MPLGHLSGMRAHTLDHAPTPHPIPYILTPALHSLQPAPYTLHLTPHTLHLGLQAEVARLAAGGPSEKAAPAQREVLES